MTFSLGFNFRSTAPFVTDGSEGVPMLGEEYPHTYTNGNGYSVNAGWTITPDGHGQNRDPANDARIAGIDYRANGIAPKTLRIDLDSGSNPGAGTYTVDIALGDVNAQTVAAAVKDTSSVVLDLTNGGAGYSVAGHHYIDATAADVAATTTWTGATTSKTFATTICNLDLGHASASGFSTIAHFRLTLQAGSTYTLTSDVGAFTETGRAMTPEVGMPGARGPYALAGIDTGFMQLRRVASTKGAYVLAGQPASLRVTAAGSGFGLRRRTMQPFRRSWS